MWITQIDCTENSIVQAPGGCNQYYFGREGIIKTFNFEGVQYLANQNYKMCIRANQDSCFVRYFADTNHFMLQVFFLNSYIFLEFPAKKNLIKLTSISISIKMSEIISC